MKRVAVVIAALAALAGGAQARAGDDAPLPPWDTVLTGCPENSCVQMPAYSSSPSHLGCVPQSGCRAAGAGHVRTLPQRRHRH